VLIVRAYDQPESENVIVRYRRILLPIDSSRRAECALSAGIALAQGETLMDSATKVNSRSSQTTKSAPSSLRTKLILAAVIKRPELPIPEPYPVEIEQLSKQLVQVSHQAVSNYLSEMKERLSVECETCVVENNSITSAIQELASQEEEIDLVVLCAHGYTGKSTWPYGSIARNYMEHGTKPVLVIQDIPRSHVQSTVAEIAAEKTGGS
jgi:nucleotide-binding universal stress UspA family protein